jgi:hypothetical protein
MFVIAFRGVVVLAVVGLLAAAGDEPKPKPVEAVAAPAGSPDTPPRSGEEAPLTESVRIRKLLNQPTDKIRNGIDPGQTLKDVLDFVSRSHGLTFRVEHAAFRAEGQDGMEERQLARGLPATRNLTLATVLNELLSQVEPPAAFIVRRYHVAVVPMSHTLAEYTMREPVYADFDKLPLQDALKELAEQTGSPVLLDARRAGEKAKTPVTATLQNVSLGTAVQLLANMAELKAVLVDNTIYVTTEQNAAKLEEEETAKPVPHGPPPGGGAAQ